MSNAEHALRRATIDASVAGVPGAVAGLPWRAGIGLKPQHFREVLASRPDIGFFEVHAENYTVDGGPFHHFLGRVRENYPLSLHGVGLSIGGVEPLDESHLDRLATLIARYQPASFSEHLAWSSHGGTFFNDLLPVPYDRATLDRVCEHIDRVQERLQRRMLLENPSTYLEFEASSTTSAVGSIVNDTTGKASRSAAWDLGKSGQASSSCQARQRRWRSASVTSCRPWCASTSSSVRR